MEKDFLHGLTSVLEPEILEFRSALSHAWLWLGEAFFMPGDYLLGWFIALAPVTADSLGLDAADRVAMSAALLSAVAWLTALLLARAACNGIRSLLAPAFFATRRLGLAALHRLRMFRWRMAAPMRRMKQRLRVDKHACLEEFHINELQTAILHVQGKLAPGHVMTAPDIADELGIRPSQAQQALDTLKKLHLVDVSFATTDGFAGYLLTRPGRLFLASCARRAAAGH